MKKNGRYDWSGDTPPDIEPHSVNKLELVKGYLKEYLKTIARGGFRRRAMPLYIVDGFCGGGLYLHDGKPYPGSPLQILDAAHEFLLELPAGSPLQTDFHFVFVDKDKASVKFLTNQIARWSKERGHPWEKERIRVLHADINAVWKELVQEIRGAMPKRQRAVFFLDQYGYTDLKIPTIWGIMRNLNAPEVICTIATDWLADFHRKPDELRERLRKMGVMDSVTDKHIAQLSRAKASKSITGQTRRGLCQQIVVESITAPGIIPGPVFYNPYCIRSIKSRKSYVLLHLAKNIRAKDVMLEQQWRADTCVHEGNAGLAMLVFDALESRVDYLFDEEAKERSKEEIKMQLHPYIAIEREITAGQLYEKIANETPAKREIVYSVIEDMAKDGQVEILTPTRRKANKVNDETIIRLPKQLSFLL